MYGAFEEVAAGPARALRSGADMLGIGLCPEGIEQNPAAYALMNEWAFRCAPPYPNHAPLFLATQPHASQGSVWKLDMVLATSSQCAASAQCCRRAACGRPSAWYCGGAWSWPRPTPAAGHGKPGAFNALQILHS